MLLCLKLPYITLECPATELFENHRILLEIILDRLTRRPSSLMESARRRIPNIVLTDYQTVTMSMMQVCLLLRQYLPLQAARSSVSREFSRFYKTHWFITLYLKPGMDYILNQLHPFYTFTPYFSKVIKICPTISSGLFPLGLPTELSCEFPSFHACYIHRPSHSLSFNYPRNGR